MNVRVCMSACIASVPHIAECVSCPSTGNVAKVADFGLSRFANGASGAYHSTSGIVPLKWTAPEAFTSGKFISNTNISLLIYTETLLDSCPVCPNEKKKNAWLYRLHVLTYDPCRPCAQTNVL